MLKKLETFALLLSALLALAIEGAFVYWIRIHPLPPRLPEASSSLLYVGHWTSPTLPQYWLVGALLALFYYLFLFLQNSVDLKPKELIQSRRNFLRIWYCFLVLAGAQGCFLYLDYFLDLRR